MERRALVKGFLGVLGTAILAPMAFPARLLAWGAIRGWAPTHQYILTRAMQALSLDPVFRNTPFPTAEQLTGWDFVEISLFGGKSGAGPDMDGNSSYSWHYYNPERGLGEAPARSAEFFRRMIAQRAQSSDSAQATAWGAHFLADMFVPYHTIGIPAAEAHNRFVLGAGSFSETDCGPPHLLYSLTEAPPPGWGGGNDYTDALGLFCTNYPLGSEADWFDPWYFNGYLGGWSPGIAGVATGSHGAWEYWGWANLTDQGLEQRVQTFLGESFYDPLWTNSRADFEQDGWEQQALGIERFARACAARTRNPANFETVLRNPDIGIAAAVRAVLTFFRASVTAISLRAVQEPLGNGGYRLICVIQNGHPDEHLMDIDVRIVYNLEGRWLGGITRYQGVLGPSQSGTMSWDFPDGRATHGVFEVVGTYPFTPDLGYARTRFQTAPGQERIDPEVLATWQGRWTLSGRDLTGANAGQTSHLGSFEIWVEGTSARFRLGDSDRILPVTVVDNGRCIQMNWSGGGAELTGRWCMGSDGSSFTGRVDGNPQGQSSPVQAECWGSRVR